MKINNISAGKILILIGLISVVVLTIAVIWHNLNLSFFVGLLFNDAKEFADKGVITSDFMPLGYSGLLGLFLKIGGIALVPAFQSLIYIGILLATFWFLRPRGKHSVLSLLGILAIAIHPVLLINIWRIHDGNLTVLILLGFLASGISYLRYKNFWSVLALGLFTGLLFTVRPNAILLALVAIYIFYERGSAQEKIKFIGRSAIFFISAIILVVISNSVMKGKMFYFAEHGFYNLFAGSNEYASKYLLKDLSGENSLEEALKARGFSSVDTFEERLAFPTQTYKRLAIEYVKSHPLEYAKLTAIKIFTFFRPGYQATQGSGLGLTEVLKRVLKIILATPFFIWIFFVYKTRRDFFKKENMLVFLSVALYVLPFLIANADPRYRFPLDIILIADSFRRAQEFFAT